MLIQNDVTLSANIAPWIYDIHDDANINSMSFPANVHHAVSVRVNFPST